MEFNLEGIGALEKFNLDIHKVGKVYLFEDTIERYELFKKTYISEDDLFVVFGDLSACA